MLTRRSFVTHSLATSLAATALPSAAQESFQLDPLYEPQFVRIKKVFAPGQILIQPHSHFLYFVTEPRKAIRYGVGVGKAGLAFTGTATIDVKKEWPTWRPTDEMIEREPHTYAKFIDNDFAQPGGPGNPLGARALYLFQNQIDTYFRIHGTNQPQSIGRSVSNGCIRMLNAHVIHLYEHVPIGTVVTVV